MSTLNLKATVVDISLDRGDAITIPIRFKQNGAVLDITGWTFNFSVNPKPNPEDASAHVITKTGLTPTNAVGGELDISLTPTETNLLPKTWYYDVQRVLPSIKTLMKGKFTVDQDITK